MTASTEVERVARLLDPEAWAFHDENVGKPVMRAAVSYETRRSLMKAHMALEGHATIAALSAAPAQDFFAESAQKSGPGREAVMLTLLQNKEALADMVLGLPDVRDRGLEIATDAVLALWEPRP